MKPTIDIIIPTYNRIDLLPETLKSVQDQSFSDWQCWIAEDGATQQTADAVKPFLKDRRFTYLPGEHAGFPAVPRNRAIREGTAELVTILDDDDLWLPGKLERQLDFMKTHPDCVLLGCNAFRWPGEGKWDECPVYFKEGIRERVTYEALLQENRMIHSSAMIRRAALEQAGLYNEGLNPPIGEDYELWLRLGALGEVWVIEEPLMVFRETALTYYSKLDRSQNYQAAEHVFEAVLKGTGDMPSPLTYPENAHLADACRGERDFYLKGPRFLGRFRHELSKKIKKLFASKAS